MNTFFLKVIASDKVFFSGKAEMVNIPTLDGEKVFLAHHENIVIAIEMGDLKFRTEDGETHHAVVGKGFAQVINNRVTVLADSVERPEDIDVNRARRAEDAAKEALLQKKSMQEHRNAEAQLARAISRLRTKEHWNSGR